MALGLTRLAAVESLRHPAATAVAARGEALSRELAEQLSVESVLGGSALLIGGRSALLREEKPDIDIRVFVRTLDEFEAVCQFLRSTFSLEKEEDRSSKEYLRGTGLPARVFVWSETIDGYSVSVEVQVRGAMVYLGIARQRLEKASDLEFQLYLNLKANLKQGDRDAYNRFKKQENKFWDFPAKYNDAIQLIHQQTVGNEKRLGRETQAEHMMSVALKCIALGGDEMDYVTGALHDTLEENRDPKSWPSVISENLVTVLDPEQIAEVIERIQILTEEKSAAPLPAEIQEGLSRFLDQAKITEIKDRDYYAKYVARYRRFMDTLLAHASRIRVVELADRWSAMEDLEYLRPRGHGAHCISFGRMKAAIDAFAAPAYLVRKLMECAGEWGISVSEIDQVASLFWDGNHA